MLRGFGNGVSPNPVGKESVSARNVVSVDTILANELNKLTFRERESINEEIHGIDVRNIEELRSAEETMELLKKSFRELDIEIKKLCSAHGNNVGEIAYAFNRSQKLYGSTPKKGTYLNKKEIRIMFIRCERFDCQKAAIRLCRFADLMYDLYGDVGLERNARMSDLSNEEIIKLKQGCCQLFPGRDRAGRRIYAHFFSSTWQMLSTKSRCRIAAYIFMNLLLNDVLSQRRGIVGVIWIREENQIDVNDFIIRGKVMSRTSIAVPMRIGATHFCFPTIKSVKNEAIVHMISGIARQIKPHLRIHSGSPMECFYTLASFGITPRQIPLNIASDDLDLTHHNRWLELCVAREKDANLQKQVIECPNNSDILFGRGQIVMTHPGNIMFRNFIQSNLETYMSIKSRKEATQWTGEAVHTLKTEYGARFLKEQQIINSNITTWVEVSQHESVRSKLRIAFRDARKRLTKFKENETINSTKSKNDASRREKESSSCEDNEPLPLISSTASSKRDNGEISTIDDYLSSSSLMSKEYDDHIAIPETAIPEDSFSLQMPSFQTPQQQQQYESSAAFMQEFERNIDSLNGSLNELNSNLKKLVGQQIFDSSTSAFSGLDGSSNNKRQRLCSRGFFDCS